MIWGYRKNSWVGTHENGRKVGMGRRKESSGMSIERKRKVFAFCPELSGKDGSPMGFFLLMVGWGEEG